MISHFLIKIEHSNKMHTIQAGLSDVTENRKNISQHNPGVVVSDGQNGKDDERVRVELSLQISSRVRSSLSEQMTRFHQLETR